MFVKCKQCGELKPDSSYRRYYNRTNGINKTCLQCEAVNTRVKYLKHKELLSDAEKAELTTALELYALLQSQGLRPPGAGRPGVPVSKVIEETKARLEVISSLAKSVDEDAATPPNLLYWLTCDLSEFSPWYLQDEIATNLQETYRPVIRIEQGTLQPIYDDTYREVLNKILKRFDDFEDANS